MLNQINLFTAEKPARAPSPARTSKPARAAARKSQPNYIEKIFKISAPYLRRVVTAGHLTESDLLALQKQSRKLAGKDASDTVAHFNALYYALVKKRFQSQYKNASASLHRFIDADRRRVKIVWGNCLDVMRSMKTESAHLMVTSLPYSMHGLSHAEFSHAKCRFVDSN